MTLFVDTSVWSLAMRRDEMSGDPAVARLQQAIEGDEPLFTTGLVLQELLQGFGGPKARQAILERFAAIPFVAPDRQDHVAAADLRSLCRRQGVQVGTVDALLAQICIRHELVMLTTDGDFRLVSRYAPLRLWQA